MFKKAFVTPQKNGEPIAKTILLGGSAILGVFTLMKDTIAIPFYLRAILLKGDDDEPIGPSENLKKVFNEVKRDAKEHITQISPVEPMLVSGLHSLYVGAPSTHIGVIVGLPAYFDFNTNDNVNVDGHKVISPVDFNQTKIEDPPEYLRLSDNAKKYAIAREMLHGNSGQLYLNCLLPAFVAYSMSFCTENLASLLTISRYPMFIGSLYYTSMVAFGVLVWISTSSVADDFFESMVESNIQKFGDEYVKGAQEYYAKYIDRKSSDVVKNEKNTITKIIKETLLHIKIFSSEELNSKKLYYENLVNENKAES